MRNRRSRPRIFLPCSHYAARAVRESRDPFRSDRGSSAFRLDGRRRYRRMMKAGGLHEPYVGRSPNSVAVLDIAVILVVAWPTRALSAASAARRDRRDSRRTGLEPQLDRWEQRPAAGISVILPFANRGIPKTSPPSWTCDRNPARRPLCRRAYRRALRQRSGRARRAAVPAGQILRYES